MALHGAPLNPRVIGPHKFLGNMDEPQVRPAGAEMPVVEYNSPLSRRLADFAGIFQDLGFCKNACKRAVEMLEQPDEHHDKLLLRTLWTAALIAYVRCFSAGKRYGLTPEIFTSFDGDPLAAHQFYKDLRDKHIAHSVNPFEQVKVGVVLSTEYADVKQVEGVTTLVMSHLVPDREGVFQLGLLAHHAQQEVARQARELEQQVIIEARTLPVSDLYKRPRIRTTAPGSDAAAKPRR